MAKEVFPDPGSHSGSSVSGPGGFEEARRLFYAAIERQKQGSLAEAEDLYLRVLALTPGRVSVLVNLSAVLLQQGKSEEALPHIERALEQDAGNDVAWLNKAMYLHSRRQFEDALACCDRAIVLNPDSAEAPTGRGIVLMDAGRDDEALASFDRALAIRPDHVDALCKRGRVLKSKERNEDALTSLEQALAVKPDCVEAFQQRGHVLQKLGRRDEAIESYRQALASGGNAEELRYFLSALGAAPPPPVSPPQLMVGLFDHYADGFDRHQAQLEYCAPQALHDALAAVLPAGGWDIADLGCGTGQCGALFRTAARTLTGVDLSPRMIDKARERGAYDSLVCGDVVEFLRSRPESFDLILAADVFIYIGDLGPAFGAARSALRDGGYFAFSLETHEGAGYVVRPSRRYAQSPGYLRECAAAAGFVEAWAIPIVLRKEYGRPVDGVIAALRRPGS